MREQHYISYSASTDITGEETAAAAGSPIFYFLCGFSTSAVLKVFSASHLFPIGFLQ